MKKSNKEIIQERCEKHFLLNYYKSCVERKVKQQLSESGDGGMWASRAKCFFEAYVNSLLSFNNQLSVSPFLADMSLDSAINVYLISGNQKMLNYIECLPGMSSDIFQKIKDKNNKVDMFFNLCAELDIEIKDIVYGCDLSNKELSSLFLLNNIDLSEMQSLFLNNEPKEIELLEQVVHQNHCFATMVYCESLEDFKTNFQEKALYLRSENEFYLLSEREGVKEEYLALCKDSCINPFYFKNKDEENFILRNLNFY